MQLLQVESELTKTTERLRIEGWWGPGPGQRGRVGGALSLCRVFCGWGGTRFSAALTRTKLSTTSARCHNIQSPVSATRDVDKGWQVGGGCPPPPAILHKCRVVSMLLQPCCSASAPTGCTSTVKYVSLQYPVDCQY